MQINYYLNKRSQNPDDEAAIYVYIRYKKQTIALHSGLFIHPQKWDTRKQQSKQDYGSFDTIDVNEALHSMKERILKEYEKLLKTKPEASATELKRILQKIFKETSVGASFWNTFELFLNLKKRRITKVTEKKYLTVKKHLIEFAQKEKVKLEFDTINLLLMERFEAYLIDKNFAMNTIDKIFDSLKCFLNWSCERGYLDTKIEYKTNTTEPSIIFLSKDELQRLQAVELNKESHKRVRDVFLLLCYTGIRFSDLRSVKRENIDGDTLFIRVQKTKEPLQIPLLQAAKDIINKYQFGLPIISNQKFNEHLKEVSKLAGINKMTTKVYYKGGRRVDETKPKYEYISSHTGRKTFISLALQGGVHSQIVMAIVGHKDFSTLKKYFSVINDEKQAAIKQLESYMSLN